MLVFILANTVLGVDVVFLVMEHVIAQVQYSLSVHLNTLAIGAPFRKGDFVAEGTIVVFERENPSQLFYVVLFTQSTISIFNKV